MPAMPQRPFDLDKAKFHFGKSGIGNTAIDHRSLSPAAIASPEMAVLMQDAAHKIGLNLNIKRVPADGYWANYWLKSAVCFGNINPRPSADILLTLFFKSDASWNEFALEEPEVRPVADRRPRRNRRGQAQADVRRHADHDPRGGRHRHPAVHQPAGCAHLHAEGPARRSRPAA